VKNERVRIARLWAKTVAAVAVCAAGAYCMHVTGGETGIGWAILGLMIIW